jgi:hypothetical protein
LHPICANFHTETKHAEFLLQASINHGNQNRHNQACQFRSKQNLTTSTHRGITRRNQQSAGEPTPIARRPQATQFRDPKSKGPARPTATCLELKPTTSSRMTDRSIGYSTARGIEDGRRRGEGAHRAVRVRAGDRRIGSGRRRGQAGGEDGLGNGTGGGVVRRWVRYCYCYCYCAVALLRCSAVRLFGKLLACPSRCHSVRLPRLLRETHAGGRKREDLVVPPACCLPSSRLQLRAAAS